MQLTVLRMLMQFAIFNKGMSPVIIFSVCQFMRYDHKTSHVSCLKDNNEILKSLLGANFKHFYCFGFFYQL